MKYWGGLQYLQGGGDKRVLVERTHIEVQILVA